MTDLISREAAISELTLRRSLLDAQNVVTDVCRDLSIYDICIDAIRALPVWKPKGNYCVSAIAQNGITIGYRMRFVSAASEAEAIGLAIMAFKKREPDWSFCEAAALLVFADLTQGGAAQAPVVTDGWSAAIAWMESYRDNYIKDCGIYDPETGQTEFPDGGEFEGTLEDMIEDMRKAQGGEA